MSTIPHWPCECINWARSVPIHAAGPDLPTNHHPSCEYVAEEKAARDGKHVVFFINDHDFGEGALAHNRRAAVQWFAAFLENLGDGDEIDVTFKRQDMTQAELDALPEI